MQNLKQGLGLVIGIIIVAILAVGGYFVYQKVSNVDWGYYKSSNAKENGAKAVAEMANWKTYLNAKYGFEFKYPPGFKVNDKSTPSSPDAKGIQKDVVVCDVNNECIYFANYNNSPNLFLSNFHEVPSSLLEIAGRINDSIKNF